MCHNLCENLLEIILTRNNINQLQTVTFSLVPLTTDSQPGATAAAALRVGGRRCLRHDREAETAGQVRDRRGCFPARDRRRLPGRGALRGGSGGAHARTLPGAHAAPRGPLEGEDRHKGKETQATSTTIPLPLPSLLLLPLLLLILGLLRLCP